MRKGSTKDDEEIVWTWEKSKRNGKEKEEEGNSATERRGKNRPMIRATMDDSFALLESTFFYGSLKGGEIE